MHHKQEAENKRAIEEKKKSAEFVEKAEWQWAKAKLFNLMIRLDSISALKKEGRTPEQIGMDCLVNDRASHVVQEWIDLIEGEAQEYLEFINKPEREELIIRD